MDCTDCNHCIIDHTSDSFYPAYNPSPKSIPIAIVNHDEGNNMQGQKVNVGKNLEDKLTDSDSDKIKWVSVDSEKKRVKV